PLVPIARLRHQESGVRVRNGRLVHEVVSRIVERRSVGGTRRVSLRVRGDPAQARRPLGALRHAGITETTDLPLIAAVFGPEAAPQWRETPLDTSASVSEAVAAALRDYSARLIRNQAVLLEGSDPEGVHQTRVACRRLRSALQTFAPLLDPAWADALREELSSLASDLGKVRDTEVLLMRLRASAADHGLDAVTADRLLGGLAREREEARDALLRRLMSPEHAEQLDRLLEAARAPSVLTSVAERPATDCLMPLVTGSWRKLRRRIHRLSDRPTDLELHRARIATKRCRYAVLALAPLLGDDPARAASLLGELQDALGEQHDAVVAAEWLQRFSDQGMGFVAGILFAAERARADRGRRKWRKRWRAVDRREAWRWAR
ncbi:MAG: CHAD domain-containing protein, partial [Candidatus Dormiibacterota bacterium]